MNYRELVTRILIIAILTTPIKSVFGINFVQSDQTNVDNFFSSDINFSEVSQQNWQFANRSVGMSAEQVYQNNLKYKLYIIKQSAKLGFNFVRALDAGAGIGQTSEHILTQLFQKVDIVERSQNMLNISKRKLGDKIINYYFSSLENFKFEHKYDLIWASSIFLYLSDSSVKKFLQNAKDNLNEGGVIFIKERMSLTEKLFINKNLGALFRPLRSWKNLFLSAGLSIEKFKEQQALTSGNSRFGLFFVR